MGEDEVVPIGVMQEDEESEGFVDVVRVVVGYKVRHRFVIYILSPSLESCNSFRASYGRMKSSFIQDRDGQEEERGCVCTTYNQYLVG